MGRREMESGCLLWLRLKLMNIVGLRLINSAKIDLPQGRFMDRELHFAFQDKPWLLHLQHLGEESLERGILALLK